MPRPSPLAPLATLLLPQHLGVDGKHPFHPHSPLEPYFLVTDQTSQDFSLPTYDISPAELEDQEKPSAQQQPSNVVLSGRAQDAVGTQDPSHSTAPRPFSQSKTLLSRQLQLAHKVGEQHRQQCCTTGVWDTGFWFQGVGASSELHILCMRPEK